MSTGLSVDVMSQDILHATVRTPFGRFGGAPAVVRPDDLAWTTIKVPLALAPTLENTAANGCRS